jgi:hypothetical protein
LRRRDGSFLFRVLGRIEEIVFYAGHSLSGEWPKRFRKNQKLPRPPRFKTDFSMIGFGAADVRNNRHDAIRVRSFLEAAVLGWIHENQIVLGLSAPLNDLREMDSFHSKCIVCAA